MTLYILNFKWYEYEVSRSKFWREPNEENVRFVPVWKSLPFTKENSFLLQEFIKINMKKYSVSSIRHDH